MFSLEGDYFATLGSHCHILVLPIHATGPQAQRNEVLDWWQSSVGQRKTLKLLVWVSFRRLTYY